MWSRWDMQDNPPDILVTNYVMLNIMLMREAETPIFNQTREWLQADPSHVFHLVVDELHTYRGTAGTEVAYLLVRYTQLMYSFFTFKSFLTNLKLESVEI